MPVRRTISKEEPLLKCTRGDADWDTYFLPSPQFPIPSEVLPKVQYCVQAVFDLAQTELHLRPSVFLQSNHFHRAGSHRVLQKNARSWKPALGVGVWPERGGVKPWTREHLVNLSPDDPLEPVLNLIFHLEGDQEATRQAVDLLIGSGTLLVMFSEFDGRELLRRTNPVLGDLASHPALPSFEFAIPLFGLTNIAATNAATLEEWTCGADLYLRESTEDGGLLLLARKSVSQLLDRIGEGSVENP